MDHHNKESVFTGFAWKFSERIIAQSVSFVVSIILARQLMPDHYGIIALVTVFINVADVFVTSGFSSSLVQKKDADDTDFSTIFYCSCVTAILLYMLLFGVAPFIAQIYQMPLLIPVVRVFSLKIIISSFNSIQHAYVQRHMMFKKFFFSTLFGTIVSGLVGVFMAYHGFGVWALVMQYLVNSVIDTFVLFFTVPWHPKFIFSVSSARTLMRFGWKVLVTDLISQIFNSIRSFFISAVYTAEDLGYYNRGQQIPNLIGNNVDSTISTVLFPAISDEGKDINRVKTMTRKALKMSSYIMFPIMMGISAISRPLVDVLLTHKWSQTVVYLQAFCIAQMLYTVSNANLQSLKAIGRSDTLLFVELIKKPIAILFIIWGLKTSMLAVAISLPISNFFGMIVNMKANSKILGYTLKEQISDVLPSTIISLIMYITIVFLMRFDINDYLLILLQVLSGAAIYIFLSKIFTVWAFEYLINLLKSKFKSI